jgi:choline dehydrogenase-like flavoprotein
LTRRELLRLGLAAGVAATSRRTRAGGDPTRRISRAGVVQDTGTALRADFVVVGSGAGGGTVAARLAEAGFTVLVLEAGGDPRAASNARAYDYDVPAFHPYATENPAMRWDFWVRHYANTAQQTNDPKYYATWNGQPVDGVWYPRAGTLGGCTAHNAMILVYPHEADWDELVDLTSDRSWAPDNMRRYFQRLENCRHRPFERFFSRLGWNPSGHGFGGWLDVEHAIPNAAFKNRDLRDSLHQSIRDGARVLGNAIGDPARLVSAADPNDIRSVDEAAVGLRYTPLTTHNHARVGARERLLDVQRRHPDRLKIEMHALVTRVLFDNAHRAIGVEYRKGERLYRAHANPNATPGETRQAFATREVILAGGAFNTPQLLMLSGIGPRSELVAHEIPVEVELDGVGRQLQDRYEVSVVNRMAFPAWDALAGAQFNDQDTQYREWSRDRNGVYITNGSLVSVVASSSPGRPAPDLFCYALLGDFRGYQPGYAARLPENPNCLSWVILKGHTNNVAGDVVLKSKDPLETPKITFRYFEEGSDATGDDLASVVAGVELARELAAGLKRQGLIAREEMPGDDVRTKEQIATFVRNHAWGHHASCTCRIGPRDLGGVLSSDFRVYGTERLRVVDASAFPRVPGLFIASAVYMIGEKAAEVILAANGRSTT